MTDPLKLQRWRYYFLDLPLFSFGVRSSSLERRLYRTCEPEIRFMKEGFMTLCDYLKKPVSETEIEAFVRKAFWVKVVRESDAYTCLKMSKKQFSNYFDVRGVEHLREAMGKKRLIILMSGHFGSFYTAKIAFSHLGFIVHPIARTVDYSAVTPLATSLYTEVNYRFTQLRYLGKYVFTDFSGKIDRAIVDLSKSGGILWVTVDVPYRLYPYKHLQVKLFGKPSTLPAGLIQWAVRKEAIFLTAWNSVEFSNSRRFYRLLTVDEPIPDGSAATTVLQAYADRLSEKVLRQPWQWLGIQVIHQFNENEESHG
jgi:lauroyl/myristoyl acyltransferase